MWIPHPWDHPSLWHFHPSPYQTTCWTLHGILFPNLFLCCWIELQVLPVCYCCVMVSINIWVHLGVYWQWQWFSCASLVVQTWHIWLLSLCRPVLRHYVQCENFFFLGWNSHPAIFFLVRIKFHIKRGVHCQIFHIFSLFFKHVPKFWPCLNLKQQFIRNWLEWFLYISP